MAARLSAAGEDGLNGRVSTQSSELSFPRLKSRTQGFRLGAPRDVTLTTDGLRVVFVRSAGPTDRVGSLWVLDVTSGDERLVADPRALLVDAADELLSAEERARRERRREAAGGITAYALDAKGTGATFALSSGVYVADLVGGDVRRLPTSGSAVDPRLDPTGARVAYASDGSLRLVDLATGVDQALVTGESAHVSWGLAEFIAAEEMGRYRGFWWAPDGRSMLAARVDESAVQQWWISNPSQPAQAPTAVRYPAAGTVNADVRLVLLTIDARQTEVEWDRVNFPYLARVSWQAVGSPLLLVQSRDQRRAQVRSVDVTTGATTLLHEQVDADWVELVPGVPAWLPDGRLVTTVDDGETRRLAIDGEAVTPAGLQVLAVTEVDAAGVTFRATADAVNVQTCSISADGTLTPLSQSIGVHAVQRHAGTTLVSSASLSWDGTRTFVNRDDGSSVRLTSLAATPPLADVRPHAIFDAGPRRLRTAVLLPRVPYDGRLPVLLDPYGGPGHGRVVGARAAWLESQWLADQGYVVVVADGRGTPGRGPRWEREISGGRWAEAVLDDQVAALDAAGERYRDVMDLNRVAIRGWSFGGYLAALAVLRRPDVFAAAVAGAPVADWTLYDTHYTERYLGDPTAGPAVYAANSLIDDAPKLRRPLLIVHGLSDDNVVVANTLRLSSALLAAGRPHTVLPLSGVTHMTPQEIVAENLLLLEMSFLRAALPRPTP